MEQQSHVDEQQHQLICHGSALNTRLSCRCIQSDARMSFHALRLDSPYGTTKFNGKSFLEESGGRGRLCELIEIFMHGSEESSVLIDATLEIPYDMTLEIEFALLNEISWHVLLEAGSTRLVIHPHSAVHLQHTMQFIQQFDHLILIHSLIEIVIALVIVDSLVPAAIRLHLGDFLKACYCTLQTTLSTR